jgi:hypothetical protein
MSEYRNGKNGKTNVLLLGLGVEQVELAMLKLSEGVDGGRRGVTETESAWRGVTFNWSIAEGGGRI